MTSQKSWSYSVSVTTDTNAYAAGDNVGGLLTLTNALDPSYKTGKIYSAVISDLDKQAADFDIIIFDANPTGTTFTNNAALDIADADISKIAGVVQIGTSVNFADNEVVIGSSVQLPVRVTNADGNLYAALVVRTTPTFSSTSALNLKLLLEQDTAS